MTESALLAELPPEITQPAPVMFLPYLSGERTPHNDGQIRGGFAGLSDATTRADMTQAVLEGVAFSFRDVVDALADAGSVLTGADVIGGGSHSRLWVSIIANVTGLSLHRLAHGAQGGAFGAARLARIAVTAEAVGAVCLPQPREETLMPDADMTAAYAAPLARYRALYAALRGAMAALPA